MRVPSRTKSFEKLWKIAESQQGFFTTKQAKAAGYAENTHPYHVRTGNWAREHRGIYRLALFPLTEHPDLAQWSLWSKNRDEEILGVYSHETALRLHELSDVNPPKLHMTVPPTFRRSGQIPGILILHYGDIPEAAIQAGQGFRYTRPLQTLLDILKAGTVEDALLQQAVRQALYRGLLTWADLESEEVPKYWRALARRSPRRST
jgi:hypothetical protein